MVKTFLMLGGINGFLAVALGAFAAHGLKSRLSEYLLGVFQTGVQYHTTHAIALVLVAILGHLFPNSTSLLWSGWCFLAGIVFFSGSLYALGLSGVKILGAITPIGGVFFLAGWLLLAYHAWKAIS